MNENWKEFGLLPALSAKLEQNEILTPTPIQAAALPELLSGRDVTARSQTGTGKTLAYLLPALQRIDVSRTDLQVLIIAPTQELGMQIVRIAEQYGEVLGVRVQQLIGGASMKRQVEKLKTHPHLIVGTPGRLHEVLKASKLKLHAIKLLVVDEADQVFSLGSTKEVETLLSTMARDRQIAFFSATRPAPMEEVEKRWMREPVSIDLSADQSLKGQVEHYYIVCQKRDKVDTARRLIRMLTPDKALLFLNVTDEIANYEAKFGYEGFTIETLYGDADKQRRAATLDRFKDGRCQLLLATDVAARGLDIAHLPLVMHLDPAMDADHYVHRSGRTGRMGRSGTVISIVTPQELFIMDKFRKQLGVELVEKQMYRGALWSPEELEAAKRSPRRSPNKGNVASISNSPGEGASTQRKSVAKSSAKSSNTASSTPAGKANGKAAQSGKPVKTSRERERDRKNKGAPKWLKAKREGQQP